MGLFDELQNTPEVPEDNQLLEARGESLEAPEVSPETPEEALLVARSGRKQIENEEGPTIEQIIAGLTAEIAISGGGQIASGTAAAGTSATVVGVAAAPFVWIGGTFSTGYTGSVAAQKIEGREDISQGRALFAGLVNTIPFLGKARQGSKLAKLTKQVGSHAAQGAAIGAGEMTSVAVIDEGRLPTLDELGLGAGGGAVIGSAMGGTIEGGKALAPKTVELFNKISGKTANEIDVMVAKGDVLTEDIAEAMHDIADAPKPRSEAPEASATTATPKDTPEPTPAPKDRVSSKEFVEILSDKIQQLDAGLGQKVDNYTTADGVEITLKDGVDTDIILELNGNQVQGDITLDVIAMKGARGEGKASKELDRILAEADSRDMSVDLEVDPANATLKGEEKGLSATELKKWYERKGFIFENGGYRGYRPRRSEDTAKLIPEKVQINQTQADDIAKKLNEDSSLEYSDPQTLFDVFTAGDLKKGYYDGGDDFLYYYDGSNRPKRVDNSEVLFDYDTGKFIVKVKEAPATAAEPTPAPKTPEAAPEADPTSASGDAIDASIKATREILEGDRSGGKGAQVTRKVKTHFRAVAKEFFDDINTLIKTKDVEAAKKILSRIDKYIEFDRVISEKDYAQGSELVANRRNAMDFEFQAGISAAGNKRTEDLNVLKGMLQKLVDEDVAVDPKLVKQVAKDTKKRSEGAPKLSKEEKLDAIADQVAKTFVEERGGVFQQAIDGYFTVRLTQMLNQAKTAFVGVPSAFLMSVARPIVNTPYNIAKAAQLKGVTFSKRVQYATADIAGTYEYVRMITKHLGDTLRSSKDTILNKGDSNFLYRDRNAYIKDQLAEANEPSHTVKRRLKQAQRREAARNAKTDLGRKVLNARATVMNSKLAQVPAFFFDYGVSLIGGLEEISLIAHSMRAARAQGIKKGIDDGVDDVWKFSEDYMESAFDRSRGGLQAKYDPEYADIFNTARRDHFRAMDLDPSDIRKDMIDGLVAGLNKVSNNPDEMGLLARTLFVFIGVPMRALGGNVSYITSPLNVAKNVTGGGARRLETALGGKATFGKYNKRISELELDIKGQKQALKSKDPEVAKTAEKKLAELEDQLARVKDLKMQKDYEDLGKLGVGAGLFFLGYEMAKNGQVAGTDSWMTEEQKLAAQKVQGAPNSWKIVMGGSEYDFKYFEPLKGVFALGADYARRQAAEEAGALTEDQTITQFFTSVTKSIATDSPFATGARYMTQVMSPNPETQERGVMGVVRSLVPVPAEVRNFNKFDEEFVTDTTAGEFADTVLSASLGQETGNYRLTSLGEPKIKEEPSILSYMLPFGPKAVPEREPIDDILLEDAMSFRSVSAPQTSISGFKLKNYVNEDNETLYSLYGRLITETRISGKTQRQALNALVKTSDFKRAYNNNKYTMDDKGAEINEGIEMIKDIISEYRAEARSQILENKAANDYVDSDGNNIYDILKEREEFSEQPESLLESLNLQ